ALAALIVLAAVGIGLFGRAPAPRAASGLVAVSSPPPAPVAPAPENDVSVPPGPRVVSGGPKRTAPAREPTASAGLDRESPPARTATEPQTAAGAVDSVQPLPSTEARSYTVEATFYRTRANAAELLLPGAHVAPGDRLYLEFEASRPLHLYIANEDENGAAFLLFPLPGQGLQNPLPAGRRLRLPGTQAGQPVFWQITSVGGREHFLLVGSPERLVDLEADLLTFEHATDGRPVASAPLTPAAVARLRGIGGLVSGPLPERVEPTRLARLGKHLLERPESVEGIWVR